MCRTVSANAVNEKGIIMVFKIKHETKAVLILGLVSALLFCLLIFTMTLNPPTWVLLAFIAAASAGMTATVVLYFTEQIVGTSVIVEDDTVTIKGLFGKKRIDIGDISNIDIEPYKRHRHSRSTGTYTEYRMRMRISVNSGKDIVLTDGATTMNGMKGFIFAKREQMPDEDVSLYKAYTVISSMI